MQFNSQMQNNLWEQLDVISNYVNESSWDHLKLYNRREQKKFFTFKIISSITSEPSWCRGICAVHPADSYLNIDFD